MPTPIHLDADHGFKKTTFVERKRKCRSTTVCLSTFTMSTSIRRCLRYFLNRQFSRTFCKEQFVPKPFVDASCFIRSFFVLVYTTNGRMLGKLKGWCVFNCRLIIYHILPAAKHHLVTKQWPCFVTCSYTKSGCSLVEHFGIRQIMNTLKQSNKDLLQNVITNRPF